MHSFRALYLQRIGQVKNADPLCQLVQSSANTVARNVETKLCAGEYDWNL